MMPIQNVRHSLHSFQFCLLLTVGSLLAMPSAIAQEEVLTPFSVGDVQLTESPFKQNETLDVKALNNFDAERLLYSFRTMAGIKNPSGVKQYGGWESTDLRGHTMGHYLTALSYYYARSGDAEARKKIIHIVDVLDTCQTKIGTGYLSAFPEKMLDVMDSTGEGWAPYYTLHKILQGLVDAYRLTSNMEALKVASKMGDYFYNRTQRVKSREVWNKVLDKMEQGGFSESLLNLYELTQKKTHLDCAIFFQQLSKLQPATDHIDRLSDHRTHNFRHSNATIPQFIAAARMYELTSDTFYRAAAFNFWDMVIGHRTYSNGSTGYNEYWNHGADSLSSELGIKAGETCCTYNLIKLSNDLFRLAPDARYADYVERGLYNHILGSINPETANFTYFQTLQPGGFKTYGRNTEVFWCCTGTGLENHQRYGESIYFKKEKSLYVNLFIPSILRWKEQEIKMEQTTRFPYEQGSTLTIREGGGDFSLFLRIPKWCREGFKVTVNGKKATCSVQANGYCRIERQWKQGDVIKIALPMSLWALPTPDDAHKVSLMYGPIVLAGDLGNKGVTPELVNTTDNFFGNVSKVYQVHDSIPALTGNLKNISSWLKPVKDTPCTFRTSKTENGQIILFRPLYTFYKDRFAAYWNMKQP